MFNDGVLYHIYAGKTWRRKNTDSKSSKVVYDSLPRQKFNRLLPLKSRQMCCSRSKTSQKCSCCLMVVRSFTWPAHSIWSDVKVKQTPRANLCVHTCHLLSVIRGAVYDRWQPFCPHYNPVWTMGHPQRVSYILVYIINKRARTHLERIGRFLIAGFTPVSPRGRYSTRVHINVLRLLRLLCRLEFFFFPPRRPSVSIECGKCRSRKSALTLTRVKEKKAKSM